MVSRRVIVVGLDGATFDVIHPLVDQGQLSNLARLMKCGACGELLSVLPPLSPAAWVSFATGMGPEKHGIFDFTVREKDSYELDLVNSLHVRQKTMWDVLGDYGKLVGIYNVPMTYPPKPVNGFLVSGFLAPNEDSQFTYPAELAKELDQATGGYQIFTKQVFGKGNEGPYLQDVHRMIDKQERAMLYLLENHPSDLHVFVSMATDAIQHSFWHHMDESHPDHEQASEQYQDAIAGCYQRLDEMIGKILDKSDDGNTTFLILSDHGFGPLYRAFYANKWFADIGLLSFKQEISHKVKYWLNRLQPHAKARWLMNTLGLNFVQRYLPKTTKDRIMNAFVGFSDIDWARTKVYSAGTFGQIYVNLRGREPEGIVGSGDEYDQVVHVLKQALLGLVDPETGRTIESQIHTRDDLYSKDEDLAETTPDLIVVLRNYEYLFSKKFGFDNDDVFGPFDFQSSGNHRRNGILIAYGAGIRQGISISPAEITDLAPTVLALLGVPIPDTMQGKVITDALTTEFISRNPPRFHQAPTPGVSQPDLETVYSEGDEQAIEERLKNLGYLG